MPDPLPSSVNVSHGSTSTATIPARSSGRHAFSPADSSAASTSGVSMASVLTRSSPAEESQGGNHLLTSGTISRLQTRNNFTFKDDMEVFSPLADVQPITPSVGSSWDNRDDQKKDGALGDNFRKLTRVSSPSSTVRRFPSIEELGTDSYLSFERKLNLRQVHIFICFLTRKYF